jgi:hypothetical protein
VQEAKGSVQSHREHGSRRSNRQQNESRAACELFCNDRSKLKFKYSHSNRSNHGRLDSDITPPSHPLRARDSALESRHCALAGALFIHGRASFRANEKCAFDFSTNFMPISASPIKSGASLAALSPPRAFQDGAHFLDRIFTLFPMARRSFLAEVGTALVFRVCCPICSVWPSFPPGAPQALADCDCSVRF